MPGPPGRIPIPARPPAMPPPRCAATTPDKQTNANHEISRIAPSCPLLPSPPRDGTTPAVATLRRCADWMPRMAADCKLLRKNNATERATPHHSPAHRHDWTSELFRRVIRRPSRQAELRSEWTRVAALLAAFAGLFVIVLIRGALSLASGRRGEAWPFALLLAVMMAYELARLGYIQPGHHIGASGFTSALGGQHPRGVALSDRRRPVPANPHAFLRPRTDSDVAGRARLSSVHDPLDAAPRSRAVAPRRHFLRRWVCRVAVYIFVQFPETAAAAPLVVYGTSISYTAFLLLGGYAAGAVARQIRRHVVAALQTPRTAPKSRSSSTTSEWPARSSKDCSPPLRPALRGSRSPDGISPPTRRAATITIGSSSTDGRVAVTVADVTGHGIGSALMMSACRAYARAGLATEPDVQKLLNHLNPLLHYDLPGGKVRHARRRIVGSAVRFRRS